jgi:translation initiation factor 1
MSRRLSGAGSDVAADAYYESMAQNRIVYSTDGGRLDRCSKCGRQLDSCRCQASVAPTPGDGIVRIARERGGRHGNTVTVISGIPGGPAERDKLAASLKRLCGSGGTVKDALVEIQGEHRERVAARLRELGFTVKIVGG